MTTHSADAHLDDDVGDHVGDISPSLEPEHVIGDDDETSSLRSVEISLDSSPASPTKSDQRSRPISSEHAIASPFQTTRFSVAEEHPLSPRESDNKPTAVEPTVLPPVPDVLSKAASAPSVSSARTSVAPSLASTFASEHESITSITSSVSVAKKVRPESVVIDPGSAKLILGLAVVDFNHIVSPIFPHSLRVNDDVRNFQTKVGPTVEIAHPKSILDDEELCKILPFLALPDGAHLVRPFSWHDWTAPADRIIKNEEDYCYFHVVPSHPIISVNQPSTSSSLAPPQTVFGISCVE